LHALAQVPWLQMLPEPHAAPHAPQLSGSRVSSTHLPAQKVSPGGQAHAPELQTWSLPHGRPHAPQFIGSLSVSVHPSAQAA
jgi:hypothetical protein